MNAHATAGGTFGRAGLLLDLRHKQSDGARDNVHSDLDDATLKAVVQISSRLANAGQGVSGRNSVRQWVPGVGVAWNLDDRWALFAGVHRGFAPPRTEDLISNTTGGAIDLDPERSWNTEVGLRAAPRPGLRFDATVFRMDPGTLLRSDHNVFLRVAFTAVPTARFEGARFSNVPASRRSVSAATASRTRPSGC